MVSNGVWKWPNEWNSEYPNVVSIPVPQIDENKSDKIVWRNKNNKECKFSVKEVYKDLRNDSEEVKWAKVIWFSQNIPKHSFILWLAAQNKLMTHECLCSLFE